MQWSHGGHQLSLLDFCEHPRALVVKGFTLHARNYAKSSVAMLKCDLLAYRMRISSRVRHWNDPSGPGRMSCIV